MSRSFPDEWRQGPPTFHLLFDNCTKTFMERVKMKKNAIISTLLLTMLLVIFVNCSSGPHQSAPTMNQTPQPPSNITKSPSMPKADTPLPKPRVRILGVQLEGPAKGFDTVFTANLKNDSDFPAIVTTSCGWKCPYGLVLNSGTTIEQGTYLKPNEQRSISRTDTIRCDPVPPELSFTCSIEWNGDKSVIYEWSGQVATPSQ